MNGQDLISCTRSSSGHLEKISTENNENFTQKCGISKIICDTTCWGVQKTQTSLKTQTTDHRPQTQKTQTLKTQTSQFKVSLNFDENSLLMALIFPIVYGLDGMPTLVFFCRLTFIYSYCWTGNENRQQSNAGFLCWSRIYDCVMCHNVFDVVQSLFITQ